MMRPVHFKMNLKVKSGAIAQLGERNAGSVEVCGSIPHSSTTSPMLFVHK